MTNCGLWLNHKWVKTPLTPLTRTPVGWGASGTFLNGGAYALSSKTRHYEISAQWMGTQEEIASVIDEIDTGEPIYLTDPFSYANILPHWLAKPQAMTKDAPYFTAVRPTLTATPVEDSRNLAPNPTAIPGGAEWINEGTGGTVTLTGNGYELTRGSTGTFYAASNGLTAGTIGAYYSMRVKVTALTANLVGKPIYLALNNGSTFLAGSPTISVGAYPPLGQSVTVTAPATLAADTTGLIRPYLYVSPPAVAGDTVLLNEIDIRRVSGSGQSVSGGFFTGNLPNTETYQYAWAGTPHSSAGIRYRVNRDTVFTGTGTKTFTVSVPEPGGRFTWFGSGSGVTVNGVSVPAPGPVEDSRNLAPNPTAIPGGAVWVASGGTITLTGNGYELTRGSSGTFYAADNGLTAGTIGAYYSMRVKVSALTANMVGKPIYIALNNGSIFLAGSADASVGVYPSLGQSVTITLPSTLAADTTGLVRPILYTRDGAVSGDKVLINEIDIRRVGGVGQSVSDGFFTGNTPDTETYQYEWAGTPHSSANIRYRTDPTVVSVPAGPCTIGLAGSGSRTVNGMVLSVGQEPIKGTPGQGYTQVQCTGVTVTGYSAPSAIDRVGLSATFIEVGGWR